jgi:hypothetical protein
LTTEANGKLTPYGLRVACREQRKREAMSLPADAEVWAAQKATPVGRSTTFTVRRERFDTL